jgi:hypothetical protein
VTLGSQELFNTQSRHKKSQKLCRSRYALDDAPQSTDNEGGP